MMSPRESFSCSTFLLRLFLADGMSESGKDVAGLGDLRQDELTSAVEPG
jgi:hypothetical protein